MLIKIKRLPKSENNEENLGGIDVEKIDKKKTKNINKEEK